MVLKQTSDLSDKDKGFCKKLASKCESLLVGGSSGRIIMRLKTPGDLKSTLPKRFFFLSYVPMQGVTKTIRNPEMVHGISLMAFWRHRNMCDAKAHNENSGLFAHELTELLNYLATGLFVLSNMQ